MIRYGVWPTALLLTFALVMLLWAQDKPAPTPQAESGSKLVSVVKKEVFEAHNKSITKRFPLDTQGYSEARLMITIAPQPDKTPFGAGAKCYFYVLTQSGTLATNTTATEDLAIAGKMVLFHIYDFKIRGDKTFLQLNFDGLEAASLAITVDAYLVR